MHSIDPCAVGRATPFGCGTKHLGDVASQKIAAAEAKRPLLRSSANYRNRSAPPPAPTTIARSRFSRPMRREIRPKNLPVYHHKCAISPLPSASESSPGRAETVPSNHSRELSPADADHSVRAAHHSCDRLFRNRDTTRCIQPEPHQKQPIKNGYLGSWISLSTHPDSTHPIQQEAALPWQESEGFRPLRGSRA